MTLLPNQPQTTYDVAQLLHDEEGFFLVQHGNETAVVQSIPGHSIVKWTGVGNIQPYVVTKIELETASETQRTNPARIRA